MTELTRDEYLRSCIQEDFDRDLRWEWRERGVSPRTAMVLAACGCKSQADILRYGLKWFRYMPSCGPVTLRELSAIAGTQPQQ